MGNRPSADIFYGFATSCNDEDFIKQTEDFEPVYSLYEWEEEFHRRINKPYPGWSKEPLPEIAKTGCMIKHHGYSEEPGWFVCIIASHVDADWDAAQEISPEHFQIQADWEEKLRAFCELMDIKWSQPKWLLVSSYG